VDTNRVTLISADGSTATLPLMSKEAVAEQVIGQVVRLFADVK
jgi:hypothetical protein